MIEELEQCSGEAEKAELLKKWKEEGAFASFGVSLHFQNILLEFLSEERKPLLHLFLAAYALFDWKDLRQKVGHPLTQKLIDLIEQSDLEESLILLDEVQEFPFLFAALVDDVASAKLLLAENPGLLNEPSEEGNTALHIACAVRSLDFLSFLINEEIDLEQSNGAGKTALILAIEQNDLELVELLFEAGADVNGENDRGQTPLYVGIRSGAHEDLISCLLDHPELTCDPEALNAAVLLKKIDLIDLLLECGWEISPKKTRSGNSPLILAVLSNDLKLADYLLTKGANPQQTEKAGSTALILAAERGFTQILERLIAHRVPENEILLAAHAAIKYSHFHLLPPLLERFDLNTSMGILYFRSIKMQMYVQGFISGYDDMSIHVHILNNDPLAQDAFPPLIQAVYKGDLKQVQELLKNGCDLRQTTPHGLSALHIAIKLQAHPIFDALIQAGADIDQRTAPAYHSPLFVAVKVQNGHAIARLLELGAQDLPTSLHHTALFAAVCNGDLDTVQALLSRGSDPYQYAGKITNTLVYTAARYRHMDILKYLLAYGLHPDDVGGNYAKVYLIYMRNAEMPDTALSVATNYCDPEMIEILLRAGADPNRKSGGVPPIHRAMANATFPSSETAGYHQIIERSHAIIDLMLERGADLELKSEDGYTFLIRAIRYGPMETVIHLLEAGARTDNPDAQGKLPIDHAKERGNGFLIGYLEQWRRDG